MSVFIDRRLNPKNRSTVNRARFIRRYKEQIRKAVTDMVSERSITDMEKEGKVNIPVKDITEPSFHHTRGGDREIVHPGNKEFQPGDKIARPQGGGGGSGSQPGRGEGEDNFIFTLSREEFMNIFFDDLELPNLSRTIAGGAKKTKSVRAGYTISGTPSNLHIVRSLRTALARRIALAGPYKKAKKKAEEELAQLELIGGDPVRIAELKEEIARLTRKIAVVPYLDPIDLRYHNRVNVPAPVSQAVMFCLMDVSASMDEVKKDLAKRFFSLLYMFLTRKYETVDVVFIRHTDNAEEVDEQTFFYDKKSGGTVVLSALELMIQVIEARYPLDEWNIYGAQVSDGDAFGNDAQESCHLLDTKLLPMCRYYAYIETPDTAYRSAPSPLWREYQRIKAFNGSFAMRMVTERRDIYPVLHDLFKKQVS